jgi:uncharacterized protein YdeI (YjbR/CyaY-like superfamily)
VPFTQFDFCVILSGMSDRQELPTLEMPDLAAWEQWLEANHNRSAGVWLKLAKTGSPRRTVARADAIDAAVCCGWIDGQLGRHDQHYFLLRFTPRKPRSRWSQMNCERAERLIAEGRMKPAGLAHYEAAEADGRLKAAYPPQSRASVAADFRAELDAHPQARAFFDTLSAADRYAFTYRLHHITDPQRRRERIATYLELLRARRVPGRR